MKVLILMTVVTVAASNSVIGKTIPWIILRWNDKKSYCDPDKIQDIMSQVCRNEYQFWCEYKDHILCP